MKRSFEDVGAVHARAALTVVCLVLSLFNTAVHADFLGARIATQGHTVSIEQPFEDPENGVTQFLFGPSGAVTAFIRRIDTARVPGAPANLTVLLESTEAGRHVFRVSRSEAYAGPTDESFVASTSIEFATALCRISQMCGTSGDVRAGDASRTPGVTTGVEFASRRSDAQIVVEIGEFPAAAREILLRSATRSPSPRAPSADSGDALDALIDRTVRDLAFPEPQRSLEPRDQLPATRPLYFAVHCTAFYTSLDAAALWVQRLKKEGRRAKSHGVILSNGDYHEIWPFSERSVYATKTETCAETKATALGSIINVELHYYCGYNGGDPTVLRQATPAQYKALAALYLEARKAYGNLPIVSHKEIDRGLRDGHQDPIGFSFETFLRHIRDLQPDAPPRAISDARQKMPSTPNYSHTWEPRLDMPLVLETRRPDDCKRDSRAR